MCDQVIESLKSLSNGGVTFTKVADRDNPENAKSSSSQNIESDNCVLGSS